MSNGYERWLVARGNVFAPSALAVIALLAKLREGGWIAGEGHALKTIENTVGAGKRMKAGANREPLPVAIDRAWLDSPDREELRLVWPGTAGMRSPLTLDVAPYQLELHRAPDFVYPSAPGIGALETTCRCGEDLAFAWDEDELMPAFEHAIGIFTECEDCSRTFDPAQVSADIVDPLSGTTESFAGGSAYRFALKVDVAPQPGLAFAPDLVALLEKEFGRTFYQFGVKS